MAVPAYRGGMIRTDANGVEKTVFLHGDAWFHYMTDEQGNWLDENTLLPLDEETIAVRKQAGTERRQARRVQQEKKIGSEPNIAPRGLLIMVNFADQEFVTHHDTIDSMLNGANFTRKYTVDYTYYGQHITATITSSGSARKYFQDQSYGQYNPVFDVVGPYTLSRETSYYGQNDMRGDDKRPDEMIREACQLADADGADFTLYDNNNDGKVDFVYVLYAGEGEADGGASYTVWPHNYDLSYTKRCVIDGKQVCNYACSNEWQHYGQVYNGIGTFCHEFSHVMGLPDLYITQTGPSHHTLCDWDILDYGPYNNDGNTPPAYSAYERFFCGWLTPRVLTEPEDVQLNPLNDGNGEALLMCSGDSHNLVGYNPNPKTFYILENRVRTQWDEYLPGNGMLITKIQYNQSKWENNTVNNIANAMGVDILEAKSNTSDYGAATDAYPAGAKEFMGFIGHEIAEIVNKRTNVITFKYRGGAPEGIDEIEDGQKAIKRIENGRVIILRDGKKYDLLGNRL